MSVVRELVGSGIEMLIEGLPQSMLTPSTQAQAALALARHGIPFGADLTAGVLGGVRYATLRIGREIYQIKYTLIVLRPMVALEVFSEAIAWIEFKKARGMVDPVLADDAINYLRDYYGREFG